MKIKEICELLDAEVLLDPVGDSVDFKCACGADLMSDVLAYVKHDALLLEMAKEISGYDCVVLAQASMAHLDKKIEEICKIPVLSSPGLCLEQVKETLKSI